MLDLPKPRRVNFGNALRYTKEVCGLDGYSDVMPAFFDALCNEQIFFVADLHIPERYPRGTSVEKDQCIPGSFWSDWGYSAFEHGTLGKSVVSMPSSMRLHNPPFYSNLTIETAVIDTWLSANQSEKVRVSAVSEKTYQERVDKALSIGISYSRGEDREWAKAEGYSVTSVQEMRKKLAPPTWQEAGRRTGNNLQKESAKQSAG